MVQLWRALLKGKAKIAQYQLVFVKRHSKTKGNQEEIESRSKDTGTVGATFILLNCSAPAILEIEEILRIYIFQSLSSVKAAMYHKDAG